MCNSRHMPKGTRKGGASGSDIAKIPVTAELASFPGQNTVNGPRPNPGEVFEHTEISGRVLRFPAPRREVAKFLRRVCALVGASEVSPESVRALVFGPENPILARHPTLPGAYPNASTVRDPAYWVCVDVVLRAEAREAGVSLEKAGRPFTTTTVEAARKLGRFQSSVLHAIENRTLHVWVHQGRQYLMPTEVAAYNVPRRGRPSKSKLE
jgi:hypothetical protein